MPPQVQVFSFASGRDDLGHDVNLSPPGLVEDKPSQVSPFHSFLTQLGVLCDGELVLQSIRHLVSLRLALLNLRVRLPVGCDTLEWSSRCPLSSFLFGMDFSLAPVLAVSVFLDFLSSGRFFLIWGGGF